VPPAFGVAAALCRRTANGGRSVLPAIAGALRRSLLRGGKRKPRFGPEAPGSIHRRPRAGLAPPPARCAEGMAGTRPVHRPFVQLAGSLGAAPAACQTPSVAAGAACRGASVPTVSRPTRRAAAPPPPARSPRR
jgi:hypothetical protein